MRLWFNVLPTLCLSFIVVAFSFSASAQLYEAQGQAIIEQDNIEGARVKAMENALKKALLVAGASVSSLQQVVNGLLTQDEISIRASGSVNAIELIDEVHTNNKVTVTIRADIFPQEKQCFSADFRKSLLMTRSKLMHREQANIGGVYPLGKSTTNLLSSKLKSNSRYIEAKLLNKNINEFSRLNKSMEFETIKKLSTSLADRTDSHYILYSEITDISFSNTAINNWQFWQSDIFSRNFAITIYIYNGTSGELTFEKEYKDAALWTFDKRETVDVYSQTFWQSDYGTMIDNTLNSLAKDIDDNIMCEPTQAKIVRVSGNNITFNLGKRHGVKVGDEFTLLHKSTFKSDVGIVYAGFEVSDYKVKVTSTLQQSATAVTPDASLLGNIQINDLAVRY